MTLTIRHPLAAGLTVGLAAAAGWLAACAARLPQQYDQPVPEVDQLAERRHRHAKALHPATAVLNGLPPYVDTGNVVQFPTPDQAS